MKGQQLLTFLTVGAALTFSAARAEAADVLSELNNFSQENLTCHAFYIQEAACFLNDGRYPSLTKAYKDGAAIFMGLAMVTGKMARVSDKAMVARSTRALSDVNADIENSCTNMAVILQKHGPACKVLMETGLARFKDMDARFKEIERSAK